LRPGVFAICAWMRCEVDAAKHIGDDAAEGAHRSSIAATVASAALRRLTNVAIAKYEMTIPASAISVSEPERYSWLECFAAMGNTLSAMSSTSLSDPFPWDERFGTHVRQRRDGQGDCEQPPANAAGRSRILRQRGDCEVLVRRCADRSGRKSFRFLSVKFIGISLVSGAVTLASEANVTS